MKNIFKKLKKFNPRNWVRRRPADRSVLVSAAAWSSIRCEDEAILKDEAPPAVPYCYWTEMIRILQGYRDEYHQRQIIASADRDERRAVSDRPEVVVQLDERPRKERYFLLEEHSNMLTCSELIMIHRRLFEEECEMTDDEIEELIVSIIYLVFSLIFY